ncbi:MAG: zf-HC2 domain-containing protein [Blastocatellia bacterium]
MLPKIRQLTHSEFKELLNSYFDGVLDSVQRLRLEDHSRSCRDCSDLAWKVLWIDRVKQFDKQAVKEDTDKAEANCLSPAIIEEYVLGHLLEDEIKVVDRHLYLDDCVRCGLRVDSYGEWIVQTGTGEKPGQPLQLPGGDHNPELRLENSLSPTPAQAIMIVSLLSISALRKRAKDVRRIKSASGELNELTLMDESEGCRFTIYSKFDGLFFRVEDPDRLLASEGLTSGTGLNRLAVKVPFISDDLNQFVGNEAFLGPVAQILNSRRLQSLSDLYQNIDGAEVYLLTSD